MDDIYWRIVLICLIYVILIIFGILVWYVYGGVMLKWRYKKDGSYYTYTKGNIDYSRRTSLKKLPDNLTVNGYLNLNGCTSLKSLPDNLTVNGYFLLSGCISLKGLPENLTVNGHLNLDGCTLYPLPKTLKVTGKILGNYKIISNTEQFMEEL